eukprot:jgi/Chrzof1/5150/Cz15g13120.t1
MSYAMQLQCHHCIYLPSRLHLSATAALQVQDTVQSTYLIVGGDTHAKSHISSVYDYMTYLVAGIGFSKHWAMTAQYLPTDRLHHEKVPALATQKY